MNSVASLVVAVAVAVVFAVLYFRSRAQTEMLLRKISQSDIPDTLLPDVQPPPQRSGESYLLLVYDSLTHRRSRQDMDDLAAFSGSIDQNRGAVLRRGLYTGKFVRVRDGKLSVTDTSTERAQEILTEFWVANYAKDLDEAIQLAARNPVARWGTIEVARLVGHV
ncbi:MAG TPA: hypothetical protein VHB25_20560 [Gemmatimonadaceae bacterium]|nr:hypothetical protein [Gemmatimonadaceae bacterium]